MAITTIAAIKTRADLSIRQKTAPQSILRTEVAGIIDDVLDTLAPGAALAFVTGNSIVHDVTALEAGGNTVSLPALAGKTFKLRRDPGKILIEGTDYDVLPGGGFELLGTDNLLTEDERFEIELYQSQNPAATSSFFKAILPVTITSTLPASAVNKILQLRTGSTQIILTLPAVEDVPANSFVIIESAYGSVKQNKINVAGGQPIYLNSTAKDQIYIGAGEAVWLYRAEDGWYVFNEFGNNYKRIGHPVTASFVESGFTLLDGSTVLRSDVPRIMEMLQEHPEMVVSETVRTLAPNDYRGFYSTGDGSTTLHLPNWMGMSARGVISTTGTDPNRAVNQPGGYQADKVGPLNLRIKVVQNGTDGTNNGWMVDDSPAPVEGGNTKKDNTYALLADTGTETTTKNIGVLWVTKY